MARLQLRTEVEPEEQPAAPRATAASEASTAAGVMTAAPHHRRRRRRTRCPGACNTAVRRAEVWRAAAEDLLDRLMAELAALPPVRRRRSRSADDDDSDENDSEDEFVGDAAPQPHGLTLPAAAVGWLALRLLPRDVPSSSPVPHPVDEFDEDDTLGDRLVRLQALLPRLTHIRITNAPWPPMTAGADDDALDELLDSMRRRPRVDLRLFPRCQVLLLDQVPPGWVAHWPTLRRSLRVLRVERVGIDNDLAGFFGGTESTQTEPEPTMINFPRLTHVRFSHCELFDTSGPSRPGTKRPPPPWARAMHLTALSLARNHLSRQQAVLVGLDDKLFVASLDLSHNRLRSFHRVAALPNLRASLMTLNLSGNRLRHARGLDALVALEALDLSNNAIADMACLAPVARLPRLRELHLRGNPIERKRPRGFRVDVLDLFREQRMRRLPDGATFRMLQEALPLLDGRLATLGELKAIRDRTYRRAAGSIVLATIEENWVRVDRRPEENVAADSNRDSLGSSGRRIRRQGRQRRRRTATIDSGDGPVKTRYVPVQIHQVDPEQAPLVSFTLDEVVAALPSCAISYGDTDSSLSAGCNELEGSTMAMTNESEEQVDHETNIQAAAVPADETANAVACVDVIDGENVTDEHHDVNMEIPNQDTYASDSAAPTGEQTGEAMNETLPLALDDEEPVESPFDVPLLSPIKLVSCDDEKTLKESGETTTTVDTHEDRLTPRDYHPSVEDHSQHENGGTMPLELARTLSPSSLDADQSSSQPSPSPSHQNFRHVTSFGGLLADETIPSFGSPKTESLQKDLLEMAEKNAVYIGPRLYAGVNILENLDLYFRAFVFNFKLAEAASYLQEEEWMSVAAQYPKIQLWSIDRRYREAVKEKSQLAGKVSPKEELRRIWQEKVVACGHPALRRLTPNRGARYGFHGELLWSAANTAHLKPETIAVNRDVILCLTDMSLYLILDHDSVTEKTKDQKRAFPLPIPKDATFDRAAWPHALAFHPLQTLKSISIGFGFQRLTLRFANTTFPVPDDFTYVLLTSNKSTTVSLLKDIQTLANEAKAAAALAITECEVVIDNDDRHVLDSLGTAVAPEAMGSVLHYQVLAQRWSRGERGTVRRVCVVTDTRLYLLDEDYAGDGSESIDAGPAGALGATTHRVVDAADLRQVTAVRAADADPVAITIAIAPPHRLQRTHNWRLVCRDRAGAERLVEDVRKAVALAAGAGM